MGQFSCGSVGHGSLRVTHCLLCWRVRIVETIVSPVVPDGVRRVGRSAGVANVYRLQQVGSSTVGIELELSASKVGVFRQSNATHRRILVVGVHVQRVDHQLQEPGTPIYKTYYDFIIQILRVYRKALYRKALASYVSD